MKAKLFMTTLGLVVAPLVNACGPDPTATSGSPDMTAPTSANAAKTSATITATIAIDDALTRLLESLDVDAALALKGPLTAVKAALQSRDAAALNGAIAVAREALAGDPLATDMADLAAIALALDAAAGTGQ